MRFKDENGNFDLASSWSSIHDPLNIFGGSSKKPADLGPAPVDPGNPAYRSTTDPSGNLLAQYLLRAKGDVGFNGNLDALNEKLNGINVNKEALEKLRSYGTSEGDSPWAQLMLEQAGLTKNQNMDNAAQLSDSGTGKAFSALASRGGLSAGARERIARQSGKDLLMGRQAVNLESDKNKLGIKTQDQSNKLDILKALPGLEVQSVQPELDKTNLWSRMASDDSARQQQLELANRDYSTNVDKTNISNALSGNADQNKYNMDVYSEQMKKYASYQSAMAQQKSGKK